MLTMNVDLLPIINNEGQKLGFDGEVSFTENDCEIACLVKGEAVNFAGRLDIEGHISAVVKTVCARCLKSLEIPMELDFAETVGENEVELDGSVLDVTSIVIGNVVVELPIRFLCSEDCKGLCGTCGANLNDTQCSCVDDSIDERFAVLKSLLE